MYFAKKVVTATAISSIAFAGLVTLAGQAQAMNPCNSDNPPATCYTEPTPPAAPPAPTSFTAVSVLQSWVTMNWTNRAFGDPAYTVVRVVNGASSTVSTTAHGTFTDYGAPVGSPVTYQVFTTACNEVGCTNGNRASLNVTTHPAPASPGGTARGANETCWTPGCVPGAYSFTGWAIDWDTTSPIQVEVVQDGQVVVAPTAANLADGTNAQSPGYGDNHGFALHWIAKSTVKGAHTACAIALNVGGGVDTNLGCFSYVTPGAPYAASNLGVTAYSTYVSVAFTDNTNDETGFYLQRSTDAGATWLQVGAQYSPIAGSGGRGTAVDNSTVAPGTCYRVLMVNSYGQTPSAPACTT